MLGAALHWCMGGRGPSHVGDSWGDAERRFLGEWEQEGPQRSTPAATRRPHPLATPAPTCTRDPCPVPAWWEGAQAGSAQAGACACAPLGRTPCGGTQSRKIQAAGERAHAPPPLNSRVRPCHNARPPIKPPPKADRPSGFLQGRAVWPKEKEERGHRGWTARQKDTACQQQRQGRFKSQRPPREPRASHSECSGSWIPMQPASVGGSWGVVRSLRCGRPWPPLENAEGPCPRTRRVLHVSKGWSGVSHWACPSVNPPPL